MELSPHERAIRYWEPMSHHLPEQSDDDLLMRIQSGDEQAFLDLYRRRQGAIYRFALHMAGSSSAAEDITQEVFLVIIRDTAGYDSSRGSLSSYLFGIARKLVLRHLERRRLDVALGADSEEGPPPALAVPEDPLEELTRREGVEALRKAVLALPRRYREVVILCDLEEVDYADAAEALGCPIGTVRSRLHRARALLLEKLQQERGARSAIGALKPIRCAI
jgi:RNA polymerase sigma-70 factor (ECF subfamily)